MEHERDGMDMTDTTILYRMQRGIYGVPAWYGPEMARASEPSERAHWDLVAFLPFEYPQPFYFYFYFFIGSIWVICLE